MFLNPQEFAKAVGISYATLRKHISRGKVHKSENYIDTDFPLNKIYIGEQTNHKGLDLKNISADNNSEKEVPEPKTEKVPSTPEIEFPKESPKKRAMDADDIMHHSLNLRKKIAEAEKAEKDNELKSMEIAKKMGELMPIEMVEKILTVNIQTVFRSFENECENISSEYCEILGGDRTHLAEMTKQMRAHLQRTIQEVKEISAEEIKAVIKEYAVVRGRGQKK